MPIMTSLGRSPRNDSSRIGNVGATPASHGLKASGKWIRSSVFILSRPWQVHPLRVVPLFRTRCWPPHGKKSDCLTRDKVNEAFAVEKGSSGMAFRTGDRVSVSEVCEWVGQPPPPGSPRYPAWHRGHPYPRSVPSRRALADSSERISVHRAGLQKSSLAPWILRDFPLTARRQWKVDNGVPT